MYVFVCSQCVWQSICHGMWRAEGNSMELVLSFYPYIGSRFCDMRLYPQSHLISSNQDLLIFAPGWWEPLVFLSLVQKWIRSSQASLVTVVCSLVLMLNVLSHSTLLLAFVSYSYFRILSVACLWLLIFDSFVIVYKWVHVFWRHPLPLRLLSSPTSISPPLPTSHFSITMVL